MIKHKCICGQKYSFGASFGGRQKVCKCGAEFVVPVDPAHEAAKAMEWAIQPKGTHRGTVLAELQRYGQPPARTEMYYHPSTEKTYECLIWTDRKLWMEGQAIDTLKRVSKGKRKAYPVVPVEITPAVGLVFIGAIC